MRRLIYFLYLHMLSPEIPECEIYVDEMIKQVVNPNKLHYWTEKFRIKTLDAPLCSRMKRSVLTGTNNHSFGKGD